MAKTIYLIAGEASGDFLGAGLIKALKKLSPDVKIAGIGGPLMEAEGLNSLFPMQELSLMGLTEILPHAFHILKRIRETVDDIVQKQPDVIVTIDSPGFCLRVAKKIIKLTKIPIIHYVAPSVWAWREGRAKKLAEKIDHLLTLFPFEPPYFEKYDLPTTFVGHPLTEQTFKADPNFRGQHKIPKDATVLSILPGSRMGEINKLLPVFLETIKKLSKRVNNLHLVFPTLPHLVPVLSEFLKTITVPYALVTSTSDKYAAFFASNAALAASGTVALELGFANLPMVIAYKVSPLTYFIVKHLVKIKNACLINILLEKTVVEEKLQNDCTPEQLSVALEKILKSNGSEMKSHLLEAIKKLYPPSSDHPSTLAAEVVLGYCS
ncbi:MAG: lipid-A-disaccharide synthase [Alphaproteobacteria bacterium]|nr:lipid-A-disaccharide synthase [Alphaproteobacteria bacterium]